jgi:hypothetical protein
VTPVAYDLRDCVRAYPTGRVGLLNGQQHRNQSLQESTMITTYQTEMVRDRQRTFLAEAADFRRARAVQPRRSTTGQSRKPVSWRLRLRLPRLAPAV